MATIELMGLNRSPGGEPAATIKDLRPLHRTRAWASATEALSIYRQRPSPEAVAFIAQLTVGFGFYSIWMTVFADFPEVQEAILRTFLGTYNATDENGVRVVRVGGLI